MDVLVGDGWGGMDGDGTEGKVGTVVGESDAEGLGEEAGAMEALGGMRDGIGGADEDAAGRAFGLDDDVEEGVDAVVEVDVGVTGRAEDHLRSGRAAGEGVGGGIVVGKVGFDLADAGGVGAVDEELAEKIAGDDGCGPRKEVTI